MLDTESGELGHRMRATINPKLKPFEACLEAYRAGQTSDELTRPDDVARAELELAIPAKIDGSAPKLTGHVSLCVRLAAAGAKYGVDSVAEARGFGMVVRYRERKGLSLSARHFHAVLICGTLHGSSPEDDAVEEFLRLAEPPSHDEWTSTPRLREVYKRGYAAALEKLERAVIDALKRLVSQSSAAGETGPELLSRLFPIAERGREEREHRFRVVERQAVLQADGQWQFSGKVERTLGRGPWRVMVQLRPATEDGADPGSFIGEIEAAPLDVRVEKGRAEILVPESTSRARFSGRSDPGRQPIGGQRVAVRLDVSATGGEASVEGRA
jgi:hypothetical protein